jgi:hypothetical protein
MAVTTARKPTAAAARNVSAEVQPDGRPGLMEALAVPLASEAEVAEVAGAATGRYGT